MHVGMHVATLDSGNDGALQLFADELKDLWDNPIIIDDLKFRVALVYIAMDGPGLSKFTCSGGHGSYSGCQLCDLVGIRYANRIVHPFSRRFLEPNEAPRQTYCVNCT